MRSPSRKSSRRVASVKKTGLGYWLESLANKLLPSGALGRSKYRTRRERKAAEVLEQRLVLTTIDYTVDIANADYALNPGGLLDGDVDLKLQIANNDGVAMLQLVDVDRGNLVVGQAPFTEDIDINITGYSTQVQGKTIEFQEALLIDLTNNTGLSAAPVKIDVDFDGNKGVVPGLADSVTIAPSGSTVYSPSGLDVTLVNGDTITVSGAVPASGDVKLTVDGAIVVTGSITTSGDIGLTASKVLTTLNGDAESLDPLNLPSTSIAINGGSLSGHNINLSANSNANVTINSAGLMGGKLNYAEVFVNSTATVLVDGAANLSASNNLTITAVSDVTTVVQRGTQADNDPDNDKDQDAAIAATVVISHADVTIKDTATLTAGDQAFIAAQNNVNATTSADGQQGDSTGGAVVAVSVVEGHTAVNVQNNASITAANLLTLAALTNRTVTTTAIATHAGATDDGNANTQTKSQQTLANPDGNANTNDKATTSDGDLTLAAAVAVHTVTGSTQANISGGSLTSTNGNINILSSMTHHVTTTADGSTTTGEGDTGVGIGAAIGVADISNKATISGNVLLDGNTVSLNATTNPSTFKTEAKSGASGKGDGADTNVAGALAVNVAVIRTEAVIAAGANVNAHGSNLVVAAQSTTSTTANAIPVENATGTSLGIGASVAVHVNDLTTRAIIDNNAMISNAQNLTVSATSDNSMETLAKAGAAGGTALAASAAVTVAHHDTIARVENGNTLTTTGDVTISATHSGLINTTSEGDAEGVTEEPDQNQQGGGQGGQGGQGQGQSEGAAAIGAAVAINFVVDQTVAELNRSMTSGGAMTIAANQDSKQTVTAKASAKGDKDDANNDDKSANSQGQNQRTSGDSAATSRGARGNSDAPANPKADASDGNDSNGDISVAAAIALNVVSTTSRAAIANGVTVSSNKAMSVASTANTDAEAIADGSATGGEDAAIGAAVSINLANVTNVATIGNGANVTADGLTLSASMRNVSGDTTHTLGAHSTSGAGSEGVGAAGSFALSVGNVWTEASVKSGATVTLADGNDAGSSVGLTKIEAISTTVSNVKADAEQTGNGDLGIGASVAINITNHDTRAELENSAIVVGAHDLTLNAKSDYDVITEAKAGSGGDVGLTPVAALGFAYHTTEARIGTQNGTLGVTGAMSVTAEHSGLVDSDATGATQGNDLAIGASLGLSYVKENVTATTARNLSSGGAMTFHAKSSSVHTTDATASASGAKKDTKKKDGTGDTGQSVQGQVDDQRAVGNNQSSGNTSGGKTSGTDNKATATTADSKNDQDSNGDGVSVAAAVAVSIVETNANAEIGDGLTITSGGLLTVRASQNADAAAKAMGTAVTEGSAGIAAAVAINVIDVGNHAKIGNSTITADGLVVEAVMTDVAGEATDTHTFSAESKSGAGGSDVGVAGSLAINHAAVKTSAIIGGGASVTLADGNDAGTGIGAVSVKAKSVTSNTAKALPAKPAPNQINSNEGGGGASGVGVGASVALDLNYHDTTASINDGVTWNGGAASTFAVDATANHSMTTEAENGAKAEDVGVSGSVAVVIAKNNTTAYVGTGSGAIKSAGPATINASHTSTTLTTVSSAASGGDAAIGASVGINLVTENATAELARDLTATGNVSVTSQMELSSILNVKASAGGGDGDSGDGQKGDDADTEASKQANQSNATTGGGNTVPKSNDSNSDAKSQSKSESGSNGDGESGDSSSSGSVGVAASVAVNVLSVHNTAIISHGANVTADGFVKVSAAAHVVARAEADSTAVDLSGDASVGAAVALNISSLTNTAMIGEGSNVTANGITIEAVTTGNNTNDFLATAFAVAGNTGDLGIAGVVAINVVDADTTALAADGSHLSSTGNMTVTAEHAMRAQAGAIAGAFSTDAAVAAAIAINVLGLNETRPDGTKETGGSQTIASIGDPSKNNAGAIVEADGAVSVTATHSIGMFPQLNLPNTLNNPPDDDNDPTNGNGNAKYAIADINEEFASLAMSGGGSSGSIGFAGSVGINLDESTTHATVDRSASVGGSSLTVSASDTTKINSAAGSIGIGLDGAGIGAGLDLGIVHKDTQATIGRDASVTTINGVSLTANSTETIVSVSANVGIGNTAGIAGSASVQVIETTTRAAIEDGTNGSNGASVTAGGSVALSANGTLTVTMVGGSVGGGSTAGVGAANTTLVHNDLVEARVGDFADVTAGSNGLSLSATSAENVITVAAAAAAGGSGGGAGAVVVNVLNETTSASIGRNATITAWNGALSGQPDVTLLATDTTTIVSVAGSLAAAGSGAAGLGADVATVNKHTLAFIDSNVIANVEGDVLINADSKEDFTSVAAGISIAGSAAFAVDASVHVLDINTRAFIGDDPRDNIASGGAGHVHANGSIVVAADDQTEIDKVVGVLAIGGSAGIGAGAAVSVTKKNTEAFLGNGAKVTADGNTTGLDVRTGRYVETFVAPAASGTPGIQSTTKKSQNGNPGTTTDISASVTVGDLTAKGEVGSPKTVDTDTDHDNVNNANDPKQTMDRVIAPEVRSGFRGLAVTATNRDDIESYTVSASVAGSAAVAISAGVNVIDNDTRAYIGQDAKVNEDTSTGNNLQSVEVAAGSDFAHVSFAGSLAVAGGAGVAPAASVTVLSNTTEAYIGWDGATQNPQTANATANAKNDVIVEAHQNEAILLVGVGFGGGTVGIGAGVDVLSIDNDTRAAIGPNSNVFAGGDVFVNATDITDFDVISGGGGAGIAGVGGAVGVTTVTKETRAWIDSGATVDGQGAGTGISGIVNGDLTNANVNDGDDADGFATLTAHGVIVQASSSEQIFHFAGAVAGGFVGVAGGVTVTLVNSDTSADIKDGAQINQTKPANANGNQSVFVNAANEVRIISFAGAAAGGAGAAAGGVDYGSLNNDTLAGIGKNANINAKNDVEVNAVGIKELDGLAFSAGAGVVGLAGTVSVWSIGSPLQKTYTDNDGKSANAGKGNGGKTADEDAISQTQAGKGQLVGGLNSFDKQPNANPKGSEARLNGITSGAASKLNGMAPTQQGLNNALNSGAATAGTSAFIGDGSVITAGHDIRVKANEDVEVDIFVGGFAAGLASAGASVSILNVSANTSAISAGTLSAGDTVEVQALLHEDVKVLALAGAVGFVGLGAAVVEFHDHSVVQAAIGSVTQADSVTVLADANQNLSVETGQVSAGGAAFGASFASLSADGEVSATVLAGAQIGQQPGHTVGNLNVKADSTIKAHNTVIAVAAGGVAISANFASTDVTPDVIASVGVTSNIDVTGQVSVKALAEHEAFADVLTVTGGGGATGASISKATLDAVVSVMIAGVVTINAGAITLESRSNHNGVNASGKKARARADASSVSVALSGSGTFATANALTDVSTTVGDDAVLTATGDISIKSFGAHIAEATGGAVSASLSAALGGSIVGAHADGSTTVTVDADVHSPQNLAIKAQALNTATADGLAGSAAAGIAATGTIVTATASPTVLAKTGTGAVVEVAGATTIDAIANNTATATGDGSAFALGAGGGIVDVDAKTTGKTQAFAFGQNGKVLNQVPTSGSFSIKADATNTATATGTAAGGGILGGGASVSADVLMTHKVEAKIVGAVNTTGGVSVVADSTTNGTATANAVALSVGVSGGDCNANVIAKPTVKASLQGNVHANGSLTLLAVDTAHVTSTGLAAAGGIAAIGGGNAKNVVEADVSASIVHGNHTSTNLTIAALEYLTADATAVGVAVGLGGFAGGQAINDVSNTVTAELVDDVFYQAKGDVQLNAYDQTTVTATVDQTSGGLVGTGTALAVNDIENDVTARMETHVQLTADGNVQVKAGEATTVFANVSGASAGAVAVSGNVAVNNVANDVASFIRSNSTVAAQNNLLVQADQTNFVAVNAANTAAGIVGVGGTVILNTFENSTRAFADNASSISARGNGSPLQIRKWNETTGVETLEDLNGIAVIAHTQEHPYFNEDAVGGDLPQATNIAFNVSGGLAGIAGVVTVNTINDRTEAYIAKSNVNSAASFGDDVIVRAHSDAFLHTFAGGIADGFVGGSGTVDRSTITNTTRAFISDNSEDGKDVSEVSSHVYGRGVEVSASSRETIRVGLLSASGGFAAVAGTVSVADINANTHAFVRDSDVASLGFLRLRADDNAVIDPTLTSVSVGGAAGGAAISFNTIKTTVQAQVICGDLAATGALSVIADSDESITPTVSSEGIGGFAIAGSIGINTIETTTEALVLTGDAPSVINQTSLPGDGTSAQTVKIAANDTATIDTTAGTISAGAVTGGASVDLSAIRNRTVAKVGTKTKISAGGDVTVDAASDRTMKSNVTALGGGLIGASGAVSFLSLGAATDSAANDEFNRKSDDNPSQSLLGQTNGSVGKPDVANSVGNNPLAKKGSDKVKNLSTPNVNDALNGSATDKITAAIIEDASSNALKSTINTKGDVSITALNEYEIQQKVGSISGGLIGFGASIAVANVTNTTQASLGNRNTINADGNVTITASDNAVSSIPSVAPITQSVFGGQGGGITIDFNEARFTLTSDTSARVGTLAEIQRADDITVSATQSANVNARSEGYAGSLLAAAGGVKITPTLNVTTSATINDNAKIGNVADVGSLNVNAAATNTVDTTLKVGKVALGVTLNDGKSIVNVMPTVTAHIGDADVNATGSVLNNATSTNSLTSKFESFAAGIVSAGAGKSDLTIAGSVTADVANGATINAGLVTVGATNVSSADAKGTQIGGGLAGKQAAVATATINMPTNAIVGDATINANGSVGVFANSTNTATTKAGAFSLTAFGAGASAANATIHGDVTAQVQPGATIHTTGAGVAPFVFVGATASNTATATTQATSIGLANGSAADAHAIIDVNNLAEIKDAEVIAKGAIRVESKSTNKADATADGNAGGLLAAKGQVFAEAIVNGSTRAFGTGTLTSSGDFIRVQALDEASHAVATSHAAGGGLAFSEQGAVSHAYIQPAAGEIQVRARLAGNVAAHGDIAVRAKSTDAYTTATSNGFSVAAGVSSGSSISEAILGQTIRSSIGDGSNVNADGDVKVEALNNVGNNLGWSTASASNSGGALFGGFAGSKATATAAADVQGVIGNATVTAGGTLRVLSDSTNLASASGDGFVLGALAKGDSVADATAGKTTISEVLTNASLTAGDLVIQTLSRDRAKSLVNGAGGGLVSLSSTQATAQVSPEVRAKLDDQVIANVAHDVLISAESRAEGDADATAFSVGLAAQIGDTQASVILAPTIEARVGFNAHIDAGNDLTLQALSGQTAPPDGSGISHATSQGAGASGFVGVLGTKATVDASPVVHATVDERTSGNVPSIKAGRDVTIATNSTAKVYADSNNAVGSGGAAFGVSKALAHIVHTNEAATKGKAVVTAGRDLSVLASSTHSTEAHSTASAGAFGDSTARAESEADINHTTKVSLGNGGNLIAGRTAKLESTSASTGLSTANADAGAIVASANANAGHNAADLNVGGSPLGVRIDGSTTTDVGQNGVIDARNVELNAIITKSDGDSYSNALGGGLVDIDAHARVELIDKANVNVNGGAKVTGRDKLDLLAKIDNVRVHTNAISKVDGLGGATSTSIGEVQTDANVTTADGALLTTHALTVKALGDATSKDAQNNPTYYNNSNATGASNGASEYGVFDPDRVITFDADVLLTSGRAVLIIGADGTVLERDGVDFLPKTANGNVPANATNIFVQPIINDHPGAALFQTNVVPSVTLGDPAIDGNNVVTDPAPLGTVHSLATEGNQTPFKITFRQTLDEVHIENHSSKNLILSDIAVVNTTKTPDVTVTTEKDRIPVGNTFFDLFGFDIAQSFEPTQIDVLQLTPQSSADILIGGKIDNPIGTTSFVDQGGNVLAGVNSLVRTNKLVVDTGNNVGSSLLRLKVELVESVNRTADININADGDVWLDLRGINRSMPSSNVLIHAGSIDAHNVDVLLRPTLDQTTLGPAPSFNVDVFESVQNVHSIRKFHFRPEAAGVFSAPLSVFGIGNVEKTSTYFFNGITATGNINLATAILPNNSPIDINILAYTDIVGSGKVDAAGNGLVEIIEKTGNLQVGRIATSSGDVFLGSLNGDIVDQEHDAAADVLGNNLTFAANQGAIGSKENPIEINSSLPTAGLVTATAMNGIFLTEVDGNLNVGKVSSKTGDVCLTTIRGSIVDGNNDAAVDIEGVNITLIANNGDVGEKTDPLDLDSSNPTPGVVKATGNNVYITEKGDLKIDLIQSNVGVVSIASNGGGNIVLPGTGKVIAKTNLELLASGDVQADLGSLISAGNNIAIKGDVLNGKVGGTMIRLGGTLFAKQVDVAGGNDADTIFFDGTQLGGLTTVKSGDANDTLRVKKLQKLNPGIGQGLQNGLTLDGQKGDDQYIIDTQNDLVNGFGLINVADSGVQGNDSVLVNGGSGKDVFVINNDTVIGGGMSVKQTGAESIEVDGGAGNDTFFVLGTKAGITTKITGGLGSDRIDVAGDVTLPVNAGAVAVSFPIQTKVANVLKGKLVADAGDNQTTLGDKLDVDSLTLFNLGSNSNDTGKLTPTDITGLGMSVGINYGKLESVEVLLGTGDDKFTVAGTLTTNALQGGQTQISGGGNSSATTGDTITVTGGGSPLTIYGDAAPDGGKYGAAASGVAFAGRDVIDASGATMPIIANGGRGNDKITGGSNDDQLSGGLGDDSILGKDGNDRLFGDGGNDTISGGNGNDVIVGGEGADKLNGDAGRDILIGGTGKDTIAGGDGDDVLIGADFWNAGNLQTLNNLMTIWSNPDSYLDRIAELKAAGLDTAHIMDDATADALDGGADLDWFWSANPDLVTKVNGEVVR